MNIKSEKGAITLIALVTMLFLISFLMSMYIRLSNKAQSSIDATKEIADQYARAGQDIIVAEQNQVIPIKTVEDLKLICSGQTKMIDGEVYKFSADAYYAIQNDLDLRCDEENQWIPLPLYEDEPFTGVLDGLGHTITNLYIDGNENYQGFFGTLTGTVKNIVIEKGHVKGNNYVGSIAGLNNGTVVNCKNTADIIGNTNVTGGYFTATTTNNIINVWSRTATLEENARFISGQDVATIPKGFKVSADVFEQTIEDGMVIQDSEGNEFIWIPVVVLGRTQAARERAFDAIRLNYGNNDFIEPVSSDEREYVAMRTSVLDNGGFYIGRFEAGIPATENPRTGNLNNIGTSTMVVKRGCYPYNNVAWAASETDFTSDILVEYEDNSNIGKGAVYLSRNMYTGDKYGVVSTLCYGVQWDAMLKWIEKEDETDSTSWGNYYTSGPFEFTGRYYNPDNDDVREWKKDKTIKEKNSNMLLQTGMGGTRNQIKNIYDIAGNLWEWTMEAHNSSGTSRFYRGSESGDFPLMEKSAKSYMQIGITFYHGNRGFRPTLYIK